MSDKIQAAHREKVAYVYVRQSKMHQVRQHQESRRRQYGLEDRARQLGFTQIIVVDEDLGRSGTSTQDRPGFGRLLTAVCEGQVGAVLALEASRLARNNRDWHHLVDLCALTGTLVVDDDGVYDPKLVNDRLILGMKGSMAEFELGLMRQRAQEALRQMIARGVCLWDMPAGYVRTKENRIEMAADRQVQQAIYGVFRKFRELGSVRQTLLWYVQEQIPLPRTRQGSRGQEVTWEIPCYKRVLAILTNPAYAGAFVHGRTYTRTVMRTDRAHKTRGHRRPQDKWGVLIRDHHPAYISWEEHLRIQDQIRTNSGMRSDHRKGAAKRGPALLTGLLRCSRCGRKLRVAYGGEGGRVRRYLCRSGQLDHGRPWCISFGGLRIDEVISATVLDALQPAGVQAAIDAWESLVQQDDEKRKALELALQKARYEAQRAQRQYDAVEPENRLVAAELEARWNQSLRTAAEIEQRLQAHLSEPETLSDELRVRLLALGEDLPHAWHHPTASVVLKKRILRTVLEEIMVDVSDDPPEVVMRLHWVGGVHTELRVRKNAKGRRRHCTDDKVLDLIRELAKVCPDQAIAAILNKHGYHTGAGKRWIASRVVSLRSRHDIPAASKDRGRTWITLEQAASELGIHHQSVKRLIQRKILPANQVTAHAPWVIERANLELPAVQAAAKAIQQGRRTKAVAPQQQELPLK
jgi:DNA invertase Pin-like site-specific DNA recombinase